VAHFSGGEKTTCCFNVSWFNELSAMYISSSYAILLFKKRFLPAFIEGSLGLFVHRTAGDASLSHQSNTVPLVPLGGMGLK
jgi:hypothetical protein